MSYKAGWTDGFAAGKEGRYTLGEILDWYADCAIDKSGSAYEEAVSRQEFARFRGMLLSKKCGLEKFTAKKRGE